MNFTEGKRKQTEYICMAVEALLLICFGEKLELCGQGYFMGMVLSVMLVWQVIGTGMSDTLYKMCKNRKARGQYRNAQILYHHIMTFQGFLGLFGTALLFFCAPVLAQKVIGIKDCALLIRIVSPYLFFHSLAAVCRGGIQSEAGDSYLAVAAILRQIFLVILCSVLEKVFRAHGDKASALLRQDHFAMLYSGMGIALGVVLAEVLVLLYLLFAYGRVRRRRKKEKGESKKAVESFSTHVGNLVSGRIALAVLSLLEMFPFVFANFYLHRTMELNALAGAELLGVLSRGLYLFFSMICLVVLAVILPMIGKTAGSMRRTERRYARNHFQCGLHFSFIFGLFMTVMTLVFSEQFLELLGIEDKQSVDLFPYGSVLILLVGVYFFLSRLMMRLGGQMLVVGCALIGDLIDAVFLAVYYKNGQGMQGIVYGLLLSGVFCCVVLGMFAFSQFRVGTDMFVLLLAPLAVGGVTGLTGLLLRNLLMPHTGSIATLLAAGIICFLLYWFLLVILRNIKEYELSIAPGGKAIKAIGEILRVF